MDINSIGGVGNTAGNARTALASPVPGERGAPVDALRQAEAAIGKEAVASVQAARNIVREDLAREEANEEDVRKSVEKLNEFVHPYVTSLRFSVDKDLGRLVVKIMDEETQEVVKQIPSEEALELAKALDKIKGLLVQQKA
jgi:flagellar protein FlaG